MQIEAYLSKKSQHLENLESNLESGEVVEEGFVAGQPEHTVKADNMPNNGGGGNNEGGANPNNPPPPNPPNEVDYDLAETQDAARAQNNIPTLLYSPWEKY